MGHDDEVDGKNQRRTQKSKGEEKHNGRRVYLAEEDMTPP
jgi:hypothetical protein